MALTSQQQVELIAESFSVETRIFIGCRRLEWSTPEAAIRYDSAAPSYLEATTTTLYDVDTTVSVLYLTDASAFPAVGAGWVGPVLPEERWAQIAWTGKTDNHLTGVIWRRVDDYDTDGYHSAGSIVRLYHNVTDKFAGNISVSSSLQGQWYQWQATIDLSDITGSWVQRDFSVVVLRRKFVDKAWTLWTVWFFGYISDVQKKENWQHYIDATITVKGVSQYLQSNQCQPIVTGHTNIALGKSATASSTLSDPILDTLTDDWAGVVPPSVSATNVTDGEVSTVWISADEPNNISWEEEEGNNLCIDEVFFKPWAGYSSGLQWFRAYRPAWRDEYFYNSTGQRLSTKQMIKDKLLPGPSAGTPATVDPREPLPPPDQIPGPTPHPDVELGYTIFCNNRTLFNQYFDAGSTYVVEWTEHNPNFTLDPDNDYLGYRDGQIDTDVDIVYWGTVSDLDNKVYDKYIDWNNYYGNFELWRNNGLTPVAGHSYRRIPTRSDNSDGSSNVGPLNWHDEPIVNPGEERGRAYSSDFLGEWISVDLGTMGLTLGQALAASASDPANGIILIKRGDSYTTDGLANSGTIETGVSAEQISYTGRTPTSLTGCVRGAASTTITTHAEDEVVYQLEDSYITESWKLAKVSIVRKAGLNPHIYAGRLYTSLLASPRRPAAGSGLTPWSLDWHEVQINASRRFWNNRIEFVMENGRRARHVMFVIDQMASIVGTVYQAYSSPSDMIIVRPTQWWDKMPGQGTIEVEGFGSEQRLTYNHLGWNAMFKLGAIYLDAAPTIALNDGAFIIHLGGRAKVNSLEAERFMVTIDGERDLSTSEPHELLSYILVSRFGYDTSCITVPTDNLPPLEPTYTSKGKYQSVLDELARRYGLMLIENLDSTIEVILDPWWPGGVSTSSDYTWDRDNSINVTLEQPANKEVSQIEVVVRDTTLNESAVFKFPKIAWPYGEVRRIEGIIAPFGKGADLAERELWRARANARWTIVPSGIADSVWGGQVHAISWPHGITGRGIVVGFETNYQQSLGKYSYDQSVQLAELR